MLVKLFFSWMQKGTTADRMKAVASLASAYLNKQTGDDSPEAVEAALTTVLDDPSPSVRHVLVLAFAESKNVPKHIILSLAREPAEISARLIENSPLLVEADLLDIASNGDKAVLSALAKRGGLSEKISHVLIRRRDFQSALILAGNAHASIRDIDLLFMISLFGASPELRGKILLRPDVSILVRHAVIIKVTHELADFSEKGSFIDKKRAVRVRDEVMQNTTLELARRDKADLPPYVSYLREAGQLTPALLLRAVLYADVHFLSFALAELAELSPSRVMNILSARSEVSISALLRRAGLPDFVEPIMAAAIRAAAMLPESQNRGEFSLSIIRAAQAACLGDVGERADQLTILLRRYEAEATKSDSLRRVVELKREIGVGENLRTKKMKRIEARAASRNLAGENEAAENLRVKKMRRIEGRSIGRNLAEEHEATSYAVVSSKMKPQSHPSIAAEDAKTKRSEGNPWDKLKIRGTIASRAEPDTFLSREEEEKAVYVAQNKLDDWFSKEKNKKMPPSNKGATMDRVKAKLEDNNLSGLISRWKAERKVVSDLTLESILAPDRIDESVVPALKKKRSAA